MHPNVPENPRGCGGAKGVRSHPEILGVGRAARNAQYAGRGAVQTGKIYRFPSLGKHQGEGEPVDRAQSDTLGWVLRADRFARPRQPRSRGGASRFRLLIIRHNRPASPDRGPQGAQDRGNRRVDGGDIDARVVVRAGSFRGALGRGGVVATVSRGTRPRRRAHTFLEPAPDTAIWERTVAAKFIVTLGLILGGSNPTNSRHPRGAVSVFEGPGCGGMGAGAGDWLGAQVSSRPGEAEPRIPGGPLGLAIPRRSPPLPADSGDQRPRLRPERSARGPTAPRSRAPRPGQTNPPRGSAPFARDRGARPSPAVGSRDFGVIPGGRGRWGE